MSIKYYAVRQGLTPGIYMSWEECKAQVNGYPKAEYKSFKTRAEALNYLGTDVLESDDSLDLDNNIPSTNSDEAIAYVDGSYRDDTKEFSYGIVFFNNGIESHMSEKMTNSELVSMRNVAGEIKASEKAIDHALQLGCKKITIYHDYEGIAKWPTGEWKANKEGTIAYKLFYMQASLNIDIEFVKVTGHSGDKYNEIADKLAKEALGII